MHPAEEEDVAKTKGFLGNYTAPALHGAVRKEKEARWVYGTFVTGLPVSPLGGAAASGVSLRGDPALQALMNDHKPRLPLLCWSDDPQLFSLTLTHLEHSLFLRETKESALA